MGDEKKEVITLSYYAKEIGSVEEAEKIKELFDAVIEEQGGETTSTSNE